MQNNLQSIRKMAGITQQKMAIDLGVAVSTVQNWESDRTEMTGYSLIMVADYLGVSPNAIYGNQEVNYMKLRTAENKLLTCFRACSQNGQRRIAEYAEMIAKEYPKSDTVEEATA